MIYEIFFLSVSSFSQFTFIDSGQRLGSSHSWGCELGDIDGDRELDNDGDFHVFITIKRWKGTPNMVWFNVLK